MPASFFLSPALVSPLFFFNFGGNSGRTQILVNTCTQSLCVRKVTGQTRQHNTSGRHKKGNSIQAAGHGYLEGLRMDHRAGKCLGREGRPRSHSPIGTCDKRPHWTQGVAFSLPSPPPKGHPVLRFWFTVFQNPRMRPARRAEMWPRGQKLLHCDPFPFLAPLMSTFRIFYTFATFLPLLILCFLMLDTLFFNIGYLRL